jgi:biopolymer transport protein ExbD
MAMNPGGRGPRAVLSEINVTPLVDVMLVLLIIFMIAAGVQTVEMEADRQQMVEQAEQILEEARQEKADDKQPDHAKIGIDLPKVDSERVNLSEVKKLKLAVDEQLTFAIDETVVLDCLEVSPAMAKHVGHKADGPAAVAARRQAFEPCLRRLGERLVDNQKLQDDKELYLLADRRLDYGLVLAIMAAIRQAGVTKFGLVADPGLLGGAAVERTPEALP